MKNDTIYNTTTSHFDLVDRLKILIGGKAVVDLEIETGNEMVWVKATTSKLHVQYPDWINWIRNKFHKPRGRFESKLTEK